MPLRLKRNATKALDDAARNELTTERDFSSIVEYCVTFLVPSPIKTRNPPRKMFCIKGKRQSEEHLRSNQFIAFFTA